ncbi:MAG: hypothetical protein F4Z77_13155 [Dehalococcoidia bacterium]|nr:hypothetical protein [Dehalococcoidia bacterium]
MAKLDLTIDGLEGIGDALRRELMGTIRKGVAEGIAHGAILPERDLPGFTVDGDGKLRYVNPELEDDVLIGMVREWLAQEPDKPGD